MNIAQISLVVALLAGGLRSGAETSGNCGQTLAVPLHSRAALMVESRSGGIEVVGTDEHIARVTCTQDQESSEPVSLSFSGSAEQEKLTISGGHEGNLKIRLEVPRHTNLAVHVPAGQVTVKGVMGDKDITVNAGQIVIDCGDARQYASVEASVQIGEVQASAYGVDKGGFFRSFSRQNAGGEYRLRAHVLTGQIELQ